MKPRSIELEHGDEGHRHAEPNQGAARCGGAERVGIAEQERAHARHEAAQGEDAARPKRIDQNAGRYLHERIHVEIRRGEAAERGSAGMKG